MLILFVKLRALAFVYYKHQAAAYCASCLNILVYNIDVTAIVMAPCVFTQWHDHVLKIQPVLLTENHKMCRYKVTITRDFVERTKGHYY